MTVSKSASRTSLRDPQTDITAGVELISGKNRLLTSSVVTIEQLFGDYPFADSWFRIEDTGLVGNTITITIAATANDSSIPDRDIAQFQKVFTTQIGELGDELALTSRIVSELNSDATFRLSFKARDVKDNAIVHIESKFRGEFFERPNVGDFDVITSGTASVTIGFNDFVARGKSNELAISEDDPRVGVLGISGSLQVQPGSVSDRFEIELQNGGSGDMTVNGSGTPVVFSFNAIAGFDQFIDSVIIQGLDSGIKLQNFLGQNSALINGLLFSVKADDQTFSFPTITSTRTIKRFSSTGGWYLDIASGGDDAMAIKSLGQMPIPIKALGSFTTDDFFRVTVQDNLSSISDLRIVLTGFRREV